MNIEHDNEDDYIENPPLVLENQRLISAQLRHVGCLGEEHKRINAHDYMSIDKILCLQLIPQNLPQARQEFNDVLPNLRQLVSCMDNRCSNCNDLYWPDEKTHHVPKNNPKYTICCCDGKVGLPEVQQLPHSLRTLFMEQSLISFRKNIQFYNINISIC